MHVSYKQKYNEPQEMHDLNECKQIENYYIFTVV